MKHHRRYEHKSDWKIGELKEWQPLSLTRRATRGHGSCFLLQNRLLEWGKEHPVLYAHDGWDARRKEPKLQLRKTDIRCQRKEILKTHNLSNIKNSKIISFAQMQGVRWNNWTAHWFLGFFFSTMLHTLFMLSLMVALPPLFLRFERPCTSATKSQLLACIVYIWVCYYFLK